MNDKESKIIWEEQSDGSIYVFSEELVDQVMYPINELIHAGEEDDLTDLFSSKLTEDECFNIMEMNFPIKTIQYRRIIVKDNFAVVESTVFNGLNEYGQWYFLSDENGEYRIFDCTLRDVQLRVN
jgi:hypothetical protein